MTQEPLVDHVKRGLAWSSVNNLTLRVGSLVVSVVVARLLSPTEFGVFAVAMTVQLILGTLAEFGLGAVLIRSGDLERRAPTVATTALAISAFLATAMLVAAGPIAAAFESPEAASAIRLMSLSIVFSGLSVVPAAVLQRDFQQSRLFAADATSLVVSTSVTVVLSLLGLGALALAWARIAGQLVTMTLQFRFSGRRPRFGFDPSVFAAVIKFGGPLALANFLSWLLLTVDNLVVARSAGPVLLGFYVLAFNISSWPMSAIGQAVRVVALPAFVTLGKRGRSETALLPAIALTWAGGLIVGLLLAILATPLVVIMYGDRWRPAALALVGLGVFGGLRVVFDLIATYLVAFGMTRTVLVVQVLWLLALAPALVIGVRYDGLAGAGWAHVGVAAGLVLPVYLVALRTQGVRPGAVLRVMSPPVFAALPAGISAYAMRNAFDTPLLSLLSGGAVGLVVYVVLLLAWSRRQIRVLKASAQLPSEGEDMSAPGLAATLPSRTAPASGFVSPMPASPAP